MLTTDLKQCIFDKMTLDKRSPVMISKRWKLEGKPTISEETIYKCIWVSKHTNRVENKLFRTLYLKLNYEKGNRKEEMYKKPE